MAEPDIASGVAPLFSALRIMGDGRQAGHAGTRHLSVEAFEHLSDHLLVVEPSPRFGDQRFSFCGSTIAEVGSLGDLEGVSFGDIMADPVIRATLHGFRQVERTRLPHVTLNHPLLKGTKPYFTRLVLPLLAGDRLALYLAAVFFHDEPVTGLPAGIPALGRPSPLGAATRCRPMSSRSPRRSFAAHR